MESFKNPDFVERYEDVFFDLETPIVTTVANGVSQKKEGYNLLLIIAVKWHLLIGIMLVLSLTSKFNC